MTRLDIGWDEIGSSHQRERQKPKPKPPTAEEMALDELQRFERRQFVREKIARAELAESQRQEADEAINSVNQRKECLASEHCAECAPMQRRLAEIEKIQIANIKAKLDGDPAIERERRELLASLRDKNAALEGAIRHEDSLLRQLEIERFEAAKRCGCSTLQTELIVTGRPDLLAKMRVSQSAVNWATARVAKAEEAVQRNRNEYSKAELQAAQEAVAVATEEAAKAVSAVLAE